MTFSSADPVLRKHFWPLKAPVADDVVIDLFRFVCKLVISDHMMF